MKYTIKILEKELERLNEPLGEDEDEDIFDAVINLNKVTDIKFSIDCLKKLQDISNKLKILNK